MELDNLKFDLSAYFRLSNSKTGDNLSLSAYNGTSSFVVFKKGDRKPSIRINIGVDASIYLAKILKGLLTTSTPARIPAEFQTYNKASNSWEHGSSIVLAREENGIYSIELSSNGSNAKFNLRGTSAISDGTNPISAEERSKLGVSVLITALEKQLPQANLMSKFNVPPRMNNGNNNSNNYRGNNNSSGNTSSGTDPFSDTIF